MKVSIVIPVFNEKAILEPNLVRLCLTMGTLRRSTRMDWEVVLSDAGSTDGGLEFQKEMAGKHSWILASSPVSIENPSIGKTVGQALNFCTGDYILILPGDCYLDVAALIDLERTLSSQRPQCGGFKKIYAPTHWALIVHQFLQNKIRGQLFRHLVWSNGIFFHRDILQTFPLPSVGFLEDVLLSDHLRKEPDWAFITSPIQVSSRKYYRDKIFKRILKNFLILICFRLKIVDIDGLRLFHHSSSPS